MIQFVEIFDKYYKSKNNFQKGLIDFLLTDNPEITDEIYMFLLNNRISELDKTNFQYNYNGEMKVKHKLKTITKKDLNKLDIDFKQLDGTLLCDVVGEFIKTHKIFK
jgi:hypothetical protein